LINLLRNMENKLDIPAAERIESAPALPQN
jgi:hypothetical protein